MQPNFLETDINWGPSSPLACPVPRPVTRDDIKAFIAKGANTHTDEPSRNGTDGRVYGGDKALVHIADGQRATIGEEIALEAEAIIRGEAWNRAGDAVFDMKLCPGCYMIALFNAAVILAKKNGQPLGELGYTMARAFTQLAKDPKAGLTEEIEVILDHD